MYNFNKINNPQNGGLYVIQKDNEDVAYLRIQYGVVILYPFIDGDIYWGITLGTWVFDDIKKKDLTKEETDKILGECPELVDDFLKELEEEDEKEDPYYVEDDEEEFLN